MFILNRRCSPLVALVAVAGASSAASAQLYQATSSSSVCQFSFGIPSTWNRVEGRWFDHGWARSCNQWLDQSARWTPGQATGELPLQLPNFAPYGVDALLPLGAGAVNNGVGAPWVQCFPANPSGSVNVPAQLGSQFFSNMGTGLPAGSAFTKMAYASNGAVHGTGISDIIIPPYGPPYGTGNTVDGSIRSLAGYTENSIGIPVERGYGFAFTEVRANGIINPQYQPPMFWGSFLCDYMHAYLPPTPPGGYTFQPGPPGAPYQPPHLGKRVYDPIRYTVTDTVTGQTISGVVVSMYVDLGPDTTVDADNGTMQISGRDASVRFDMSDPRVTPQGTYELDIRNGVVVASSATGVFASQSPPPIGTMTPFTLFYPGSLPFTCDLAAFTTNPMDVQLMAYNGGLEPVPELTCAKIGLEPLNTTVCEGGDSTLFVGAHGTGALTYQWRRGDGWGNFWPIADGLTVGGATLAGTQSATLSISGASLMDSAVYDCIVTDICATTQSLPASILVTPCAPACYANCDGSLSIPRLTPNDFQCFLNNYAQGESSANCDGSTAFPMLTPNDFQCFLNAYAVGCS